MVPGLQHACWVEFHKYGAVQLMQSKESKLQ